MDYFESGDSLCHLCDRYKNHFTSTEFQTHSTCICGCLEGKICCVFGFENLCRTEPSLCGLIKTPPSALHLSKMLYISYFKPLILSDHETHIQDICQKILNKYIEK